MIQRKGSPAVRAQALLALFYAPAVLAIAGSAAWAQAKLVPPKSPETAAINREGPADREFFANNGKIGCRTITAPSAGYTPCLRLGSLQIDMQFLALQRTLVQIGGIPERFIFDPRLVSTSPEGVRTLLIPVETVESGGQTKLLSYLVVLVDKAHSVQTLQLTGRANAITEKLPFSRLRLGTSQERVSDVLGLPSSVADAPQIKGKMWSYAPFPFSFEMSNGAVVSIRISRPAASNTGAFTPLPRLP